MHPFADVVDAATVVALAGPWVHDAWRGLPAQRAGRTAHGPRRAAGGDGAGQPCPTSWSFGPNAASRGGLARARPLRTARSASTAPLWPSRWDQTTVHWLFRLLPLSPGSSGRRRPHRAGVSIRRRRRTWPASWRSSPRTGWPESCWTMPPRTGGYASACWRRPERREATARTWALGGDASTTPSLLTANS